MDKCLNNSIDKLNLDKKVELKLKKNDISFIKSLWLLKRKDLKDCGLTDHEINQIEIKMQLQGLDLNKRVYK